MAPNVAHHPPADGHAAEVVKIPAGQDAELLVEFFKDIVGCVDVVFFGDLLAHSGFLLYLVAGHN